MKVSVFNSCPLCHKSDCIEFPCVDGYKVVSQSEYNNSHITIECNRCGLTLHEFTFEDVSLDEMLKRLAARWNKLCSK